MTVHMIASILIGLSQVSTLLALLVYARRHRPK